jgi:hypothetical protein
MNESVRLGAWVSWQRHLYKQGKQSPKQIRLLEAQPGWTWDATPVFLPFEEAREFVRSLGLKNCTEWHEWCKTKRPPNIPSNPCQEYENKGWLSIKDWLGTKPGFNGEYLSFEEARKIVRSIGLKNTEDWQRWSKTNRPPNIPGNPFKIYKAKWLSLGDWIGTKPGFDGQYLPFEKAREFARSLGLKSGDEWNQWSKSKRPPNIPGSPWLVYKKEWLSIGDWLGTKPGFNGEYLSFEEAREIVRAVGLKSRDEWNQWSKSKRPPNIPGNPHKIYKKQWVSFGDWMGARMRVHGKFLPFEQAREIVRSLGLKNWKEWQQWSQFERPPNIPSNPNTVTIYKNKWLSLEDWLGTTPGFDGTFLPFEEARKIVRKVGLKSEPDWRQWSKTKRPPNIPGDPARVYKEWVSWMDWLRY